jgi:tetratricopeptide (TPR) repeat protein
VERDAEEPALVVGRVERDEHGGQVEHRLRPVRGDAPRDAALWTDRARARAARQDWANAEADLSAALSYDKTIPEIYVLRGSARQAQGNKLGYKADIDSALLLDPTYPDALVERGAMKMDAGDAAGARADFLQVLLRAPDSLAADVVRRRIEALEVRNP